MQRGTEVYFFMFRLLCLFSEVDHNSNGQLEYFGKIQIIAWPNELNEIPM